MGNPIKRTPSTTRVDRHGRARACLHMEGYTRMGNDFEVGSSGPPQDVDRGVARELRQDRGEGRPECGSEDNASGTDLHGC